MKLRILIALTSVAWLAGCGSETAPTFVVKGGVKTARGLSTLADTLGLRSDFGSRAVGSPTSFNLKGYAAYLTTSANCTAPFVEVANYRAAGGQSFDIVASPTLFSATPPAGTYNCLILEVSDVFTFRPDSAATANAGCSTTADATFDIYRSGESPQWKNKEGNSITPLGTPSAPEESSTTISGTAVKGVTVFASTASAIDLLAAGTVSTANQVVTLTAPLTVTAATTTITLLNDVNNKVTTNNDNGTDYCWMDPAPLTLQ